MSEPLAARPPLRQRLYVRIYLALVASLLLAAASFALVHWANEPDMITSGFDTYAELAGRVLPPASAPVPEQRAALRRWREKMHSDLALYSASGELVAQVGRPLPPLPAGLEGSGRLPDSLSLFVLRLPDGRWLLCRRMTGRRLPGNVWLMLGFVALLIGAGAYPVVRRLTGRLERLQRSVQSWGDGRLSTRVPVEGHDEVARLATSFNHSAERIEALMGAQKSLLANASHELRSPLARIRMAVELMQDQASPAIRDELKRNIGELDQLIDEVLLASRLDASAAAALPATLVDLSGIVAEECARCDADFDAVAVELTGDGRLLRRMVRNLLENAGRYGAGTPVRVRLARVGDGVELAVCDSGPGVPEAERERIFEPFYRVPGASEAEGGVGLGLSLVRQIARHHGGEVRCAAGPEGGCCFRVSLPAGAQ